MFANNYISLVSRRTEDMGSYKIGIFGFRGEPQWESPYKHCMGKKSLNNLQPVLCLEYVRMPYVSC